MTAVAADRWPLVGRGDALDEALAAIADPTCEGVWIHGGPGVGKTRLADEVLAEAERLGHATARAVASVTAAAVPLGALAHLLPADVTLEADGAEGLVALLSRARQLIGDIAGDRRIVALVDDAHLLDAVSLTLLGQLIGEGRLALVATVRAGESPPDALLALWRSGRLRRVDLRPLDDDAVDTVLHLGLGGPLDGRAQRALREASAGNPLFLRELVLAATGSGALHEVDGVWHLTGPLPPATRIAELIADRLASLGGAARQVLELLALVGTVGIELLLEQASIDDLEELEQLGLVVLQPSQRRQELAIAHPAHAEAIRETVPPLRRRRLLLAHAERIEALGARRREDALRIATWRLDAGAPAEAKLLVEAARLARWANDFEAVERLAGAAMLAEPSAMAGILHGEACWELGRFVDADRSLERAGTLAGTDSERAMAAAMRGSTLFWGLVRIGDALDVVRAAQSTVTDIDCLADLQAYEASLLVYGGDPERALEVATGIDPAADDRAQVLRAVPESTALTLLGATTDAFEVASVAFERHLQLDDELAIAITHPGAHIVNQMLALQERGGLAEAEALASQAYDVSAADGARIGMVWAAVSLARTHLLRGRPLTALRWGREATGLARSLGFHGAMRLTLNAVAVAAAWVGDVQTALAALSERDQLPEFLFLGPEQALGPAWLAAATGDPATARHHLVAAAGLAAGSSHRTVEAWLLHDAARLGAAAEVAARLEELTTLCDSDLVAARAVHAAGLARRDAGPLADATERFTLLGADLLAAEAAAAAADAHRRAEDQRAANGMAARAAELLARCEGARSAWVATPVTVVPLTNREREIAALAAAGTPSKQIAERLYLSVRTVNNHLQSAYTKLGVSSRAELAAALERAG